MEYQHNTCSIYKNWFWNLFMICLLGILWPSGPSSSERQIVEGDNFQKYGGMDQCISICSVIISIGRLIEKKIICSYTELNTYKTTGAAFKTHFVILFSQSCRKRARKSKEVFQITSSMTDLSWIVLPKELFHQLYLNGTLIMNRWVQYTTAYVYKCQFYFDLLPLFDKYFFP